MKFLQQIAGECLAIKPEVWSESIFCEHGKNAIFYSGLDGHRNFAWIGLPPGASQEKPVPGIVLVHGGGGTAFAHWVDYWNQRGYAAIAMDNCGAMSDPDPMHSGNWPRHAFSGPRGWGAFGEQAGLPPRGQWVTHAVASVINAMTVLGNLPEVDASRIGITGISWGAVLTCIAAGLDARYKAVCPVYGCGFLTENSFWLPNEMATLSTEQFNWWRDEWDPANFVAGISAPVFWVNGTNDFAFYPVSWQKTVDLCPTSTNLSMKIRMMHAHLQGETVPEIPAFFDEQLRYGAILPRIERPELQGADIVATVNAGKIRGGTLSFTMDDRAWPDREWLSLSAVSEDDVLRASLPENWQAAYFTVLTDELLVFSSPVLFRSSL